MSSNATPPTDRLPDDPLPEPGPWWEPPRLTLGGTIARNQILARGAGGVVALATIRAFTAGCLLDLVIAARAPRHDAEHPLATTYLGPPGDDLPDDRLRFTTVFPDGAQATTQTRHPRSTLDGAAPAPPPLVLKPGSVGAAGPQWLDMALPLWLWPLPPPEAFDLVVAWPAAGIPETTTRLDGTEITVAAAAARRLTD